MFRDSKFISLLCAGVLVAVLEFLSLSGIHLPPSIRLPLVFLIIVSVGWKTLLHGLKALFTLNIKSIEMLMIIAVGGAIYLGQYEEAAVILVLYTLAEKLEDIGIAKSQSALSALIDRMPKTVTLKHGTQPVPIDAVKQGDVIIIKPSEMIALDGEVLSGSSFVDESTITGEPIPKDKLAGDKVFAGTLNKQGVLEVVVTQEAKNTTLVKIKELTSEATRVKATTQKFIETFAQYYTPVVILIAAGWGAIATFVLEYPLESWLLSSLSMIVIACPCALVISTPIAIYSAIGRASLQGALIKGGRYLEALGQIRAIALDKTRTLTYGQPVITDIIPSGSVSKKELLACAAGIEIFSEHPLAQSIVDAAKEENLSLHNIKNFESIIGKGAKADCVVCEDKHHCIGKLHFILEEHEIPQTLLNDVERLQNEGKTVVVFATHEEIKGVIALSDKIRPDSKSLIKGLRELDIKPVMLTGDHNAAAKLVADELGIEEVKAGLLPEEKAQAIVQLVNEHRVVAMVGDGVNDAPALALSNVGISISSLGSDTALEAASVVILNDRLDILPFLVKLGKTTITTIRWNTFLAVAVKLLFIVLSLVGINQLALAIFADVGVTIFVILTSLRLLKFNSFHQKPASSAEGLSA